MPQATVSYPSGALSAGNTSRNPLLQDYVFNAGLVKPEHSSWLVEKYPQYTLTVLMDRIGGWQGLANDTLSWSVLDRTRASATISSGYSNGVSTDTWTLDTVATGANLGYFLVGDVIRTESGKLCKITAVGDAGGFQTITVSKLDGTNFAAGDAADTEKIGHAFTAFAAASNGPAGRSYLPTEEYNYMQILKVGTKVGRDMLSNKIWLDVAGGQSWYWENERIMFDEHFRNIENLIMFGERQNAGSIRTTRGIWDRVVTAGEGQVVNYASGTGISESNIQTLIERLVREGSSSELLVLCGSTAFSQIQQALKVYAVNGGIDFGAFGGNAVGLDFMSYMFFGKKLNFVHYALFDDDKLLPFVSTPTATKVNFRNVALFLDLGNTSRGEKLLKLHYRDGDAGQAKMIHKVIPGMIGTGAANTSDTGGIAANSFDGFEVQCLTEMLVEYKLPNRSGALIANS